MSSIFPFFDLPRELRDMIYEEYVMIDGGYVFVHSSGKLKPANRIAHPFAFQHTCRRVHGEMEGLPLRMNPIMFSTTNGTHHVRRRATQLERMLCSGIISVHDVNILLLWSIRRDIADPLREDIAHHYPCFIPHLDWLRGRHCPDNSVDLDDRLKIYDYLGERPSLFREYVQYIIQKFPAGHYTKVFQQYPHPWAIPTDDVLETVASRLYGVFQARFQTSSSRLTELWKTTSYDPLRYRFSAAAWAIQFLKANPAYRLQIRNIVLNEDRVSVAYPECHGRGLIRFCAENSRLRIERRVNLWNTVFQRAGGPQNDLDFNDHDSLKNAPEVTGMVALWISEALALPPAFSLVFDAGDKPSQAEKIFKDIVVRDAKLQDVLEYAYARRIIPAPRPMDGYPLIKPLLPDNKGGHFYRGFSRAILNMVKNTPDDKTCEVRCNFSPGPSWNAREIVRERREWKQEDWLGEGTWKTFVELLGCQTILKF
ncbi:hypothetical protein F4804DRAFT_337200 [Jackrogersella minutella]|nr:hypothetical protein F4804DRAFT_337200 [Jackrogersella minutella]